MKIPSEGTLRFAYKNEKYYYKYSLNRLKMLFSK